MFIDYSHPPPFLKEKQTFKVIKVVFNILVNETQIQKIPNLLSAENLDNNSWKLSFKTDEDMRSQIFDFAQENKFKILELAAENKNLEGLFRELTSK